MRQDSLFLVYSAKILFALIWQIYSSWLANNWILGFDLEALDAFAQVAEAYLECTEDNREERLYYLLTQHPGRILVFANAISMVRRLAAVLKLLQLPVTALHSAMQQRQRLKALERFKHSEEAILVATDVAARGLDIPVSILISKLYAYDLGLQAVQDWLLYCLFGTDKALSCLNDPFCTHNSIRLVKLHPAL